MRATAFKTWQNTNWLTKQAFMGDFPSQVHPSPISISRTRYIIRIWLPLLFSRMFDSLILSNTFLCNFLFVFCFGWHHLLWLALAGVSCCKLFLSIRQMFLCLFCNQVFQFLVEIMCFSFCLVNSECDAYLPVDHSLVYSHSEMLLLFFSLNLSCLV